MFPEMFSVPLSSGEKYFQLLYFSRKSVKSMSSGEKYFQVLYFTRKICNVYVRGGEIFPAAVLHKEICNVYRVCPRGRNISSCCTYFTRKSVMSMSAGEKYFQLLYIARKSVMSMSSAGENNFCFCTVLKIFTVYIRTVTKENLVININNLFLLKNCFLFSCLSSEGNLIHNYFLSCNMLFCTLRKI